LGALFIFLGASVTGTVSATGVADPDGFEFVSYVVDGDTVVLESNEKIRLIGINAPEKQSEQNAAEPYALEAKLALSELVKGIEVKVITGTEKYDRYGRTLAYLELPDGTDVQESLIERGYAAVIAFPPNIEKIDTYLRAESRARSRSAGIWGSTRNIVNLDQPAPVIRSGFKLVSGRIIGLKISKHSLHYALGSDLNLSISHEAWREYWLEQSPEELVGRDIETRGWINKRQNRYWITVRHPSMIIFR